MANDAESTVGYVEFSEPKTENQHDSKRKFALTSFCGGLLLLLSFIAIILFACSVITVQLDPKHRSLLIIVAAKIEDRQAIKICYRDEDNTSPMEQYNLVRPPQAEEFSQQREIQPPAYLNTGGFIQLKTGDNIDDETGKRNVSLRLFSDAFFAATEFPVTLENDMCFELPEGFDDVTSSVSFDSDDCVLLCADHGCAGRCEGMSRSSFGTSWFGYIDFNDKVSSLRRCDSNQAGSLESFYSDPTHNFF